MLLDRVSFSRLEQRISSEAESSGFGGIVWRLYGGGIYYPSPLAIRLYDGASAARETAWRFRPRLPQL